jgi:hypothetical protein
VVQPAPTGRNPFDETSGERGLDGIARHVDRPASLVHLRRASVGRDPRATAYKTSPNPGQGDFADVERQRWSRLADLPTPRHGLGLVGVGPLECALEGGPRQGLTASRVVHRVRVR